MSKLSPPFAVDWGHRFIPYGILLVQESSVSLVVSSKRWASSCSVKCSPASFIFAMSILILMGSCIASANAILEEVTPNLVVSSDELSYQSFPGNHSHVDYFRLLQRDGDNLLIGARNYVYNISVRDLVEHKDKRIEWFSKQSDSDVCFSKGKSESECHNYILVLAKKSGPGQFLVCGTNAYKPTCRDYTIAKNGTVSFSESTGVGRTPYDPQHNSTFVFADDHLYAGTVVDFQGMIPMIYRNNLKTDHNDYKILNAPDFVHSFEYGEFVFLFFRESAVEYMNCGKRIYSRVGRVCKSDRGYMQTGGSNMSYWTSFLKSRLNCSFPGDYPFYFDEIQSVSDVVLGSYGSSQNEIIYAIFTTPQNSIPGSAICSFSMRDVLDAFDGPFTEQKDLSSNWVRVPPRMVPEPRPGVCVNDSRALPLETINFLKEHPLMEDLVSPFLGRPILMKASFQHRFTKLTVDPQVYTMAGDYVDVLFIATDTGLVIKAINCPDAERERQASPIVIEEIHVFDFSVTINNLQIARPSSNGEPKLILITDNEVKAISLERCEKALTCMACVALRDPYCAWSPNMGVCGSISKLGRDQTLLQNVSSGFHRLCPRDGEVNAILGSDRTYIQTESPSNPDRSPEPQGTCAPCLCNQQRPTSPTVFSSPTSTSTPPQTSSVSFRETYPEGSLERPLHDISSRDEASLGRHSFGSSPIHLRNGPYGSWDTYGRGSKKLTEPGRFNHVSFEGKKSQGPVVGASVGGPLIYSAETLAIGVTTAAVAALVVGFIAGFLFSRRCRDVQHYPHLSETPYLDSKLNRCDSSADPNMYTANNVAPPAPPNPPKQLNNLVANYNPKNVNAVSAAADHKLVKPAKSAYI